MASGLVENVQLIDFPPSLKTSACGMRFKSFRLRVSQKLLYSARQIFVALFAALCKPACWHVAVAPDHFRFPIHHVLVGLES